MTLKNRFLAMGSAMAMAAFVTSADAAVIYSGFGIWDSSTVTSAHAAAGQSFTFTFEVPDVLETIGVNFAETTNITNFSYTMGPNILSQVDVLGDPTKIKFYSQPEGGLFSLFFATDQIDFYGPEVQSTGSLSVMAPDGAFFTARSTLGATLPYQGTTLFGAGLVETTGAVPEPATWAMMVIGFGLAGAAMRRQRQRIRTTVSYA